MREKVVILIFYVPILLYKKQHCKDRLIHFFQEKRILTLIICSKIYNKDRLYITLTSTENQFVFF